MEIWDLGNNKLTGDTPPEFGDLDNLALLSLREYMPSGEIPSELGSLSSENTDKLPELLRR